MNDASQPTPSVAPANAKRVLSVRAAPGRHWVGDGFPVHGMFGYNGDDVAERSPFLLLDYAAPTTFEPKTGHPRGVGRHPHRGFETVTVVYEGEVEHCDSTGAGGVIGRGDVQWMTAGGGVIHEEFHSKAYSQTGGPFEMVQLWVNLPAKDKMTPAHYQGIRADTIPSVPLADGAGTVRVIAGQFEGFQGPANTYTPMNVWDVRLREGRSVELPQEDGWTTLLVVLDGTVMVNGQIARKAEMLVLSREGEGLTIEANGDAKLLLLAGEPIDEPVVGYGPFVMNSQEQIKQAIEDFNSGRFGTAA